MGQGRHTLRSISDPVYPVIFLSLMLMTWMSGLIIGLSI